MGKIVVIHADCDDLKFLWPLQKTLNSWAGGTIEWYCLNSIISHGPAIQALKQMVNGLAVILLHGRSDGFRAGDYCATPLDDAPAMFLEKGAMDLLKGKAVYCLSCKGNEHAQEIVEKGASVYLGFDDVPFSRFHPVTRQEVYRHSLTQHCQQLILSAVTASLERLIVKGESFEDVANYLRLYVRRSALEFVLQNPFEEYRNDVPHLFQKMADTVKTSGNGKLTFGDLS